MRFALVPHLLLRTSMKNIARIAQNMRNALGTLRLHDSPSLFIKGEINCTNCLQKNLFYFVIQYVDKNQHLIYYPVVYIILTQNSTANSQAESAEGTV